MSSNKNPIQRLIEFFDRLQQKHPVFSFPFAVVKKYSDDEASYEGALITYYAFLSLFPLLMVATSVIEMITKRNEQLRETLLSGINSYFPIAGDQLQANIHGSSKTGLALVVGLLIALYGAKGVADVVRHSLNHVWEVPKQKRPGFPAGMLKSFGLIVGSGLGFLAAAVLSSYATAALGHSIGFRIVPILLSASILFCVFLYVFSVGSSAKHSFADIVPGAVIAAIGFQILQTIGGYLITHQLHNLQGLYGQFALVLALMFWLYLQAQVFLYAAEITVVRSLKLWPRSLTGDSLTPADHRAFALYTRREKRHDLAEDNLTADQPA